MRVRRSNVRPRRLAGPLAFTTLLLAALYVLLITLLVVAGVGAIAVAVVVAIVVVVHYFAAERIALRALGGGGGSAPRPRIVSAGYAPELYEAVERLCVTMARPMPRLAVLDVPAPNAFTIGRAPAAATICVTSGLLALLDGDELDAVLAHELAHLESRDVVLMTIGSLFASLGALIVVAGRRLQRRPLRTPEAADSPFFLVVIAADLVFLVSYVITQSLSRRRELVADRRAAAVLGTAGPLVSALERISAALADLDGVPVTWGELGALGIVAADVTATVATLCPTHPSLEDRRAALAAVERRLPATA